MRKLIYFLLFILLVLGCDTKSKESGKDKKKKSDTTDGVRKYYSADKKLKTELTILNGKRNGLARIYYKNGKVSIAMNYKMGKRDGLSKRYYEDGTLYQVTNYKDDKMDGVRKKYRENGKLMSEAKYENDFPCSGLKEYLLNGKLKDNFPSIMVTINNKLLSDGVYLVRLSLSDKNKRVKFYVGNLTPSGCLNSRELITVLLDKKTGIGTVQYFLRPGEFMMEELHFVAEVETVLGNTYLAQKGYNISIENK